ncbi:MAG: hypothetical protein WB565_05295 [Acidimicrobiales bacterium]
MEDIFWGSGTYGGNAGPGGQMPAFFNAVGNSSWSAWLTQYDTVGLTGGTNQVIQPGVSAGETTLSPLPANDGTTITDAEEQAELANDFTNGTLPAPTRDYAGNDNSIYALFMPNGKTLDGPPGAGTGGVNWCSYHNTFSYNGIPVPYMVLPAFVAGSPYASGCGTSPTLFDDFTTVASHEFAESVTDPDVGLDTQINYAAPAAWADNNYGEIADICYTDPATTITVSGTTFYVQQLWDNAEAKCVGSALVNNIAPAYAIIPVGASVAYTVNGAGGSSILINPPGSCILNVCSPGDSSIYQVTVSGGDKVLLWAPPTPLLTVTSVSGTYGTPLSLTTSGPGSGTMPITFTASNGTATGCTVSSSSPYALSTTSPGTCKVTALQATDGNYPATSSLPATVTITGSQCAVGQYSTTGFAPCTPAAPGYYVANTGATSATACPLGTYNPLSGAASCTAASPGSYVDTIAATAPTPAPPGSYVSTGGATEATPCAAGTFSSSSGATSCTPAPAGSYVSSTGATGATPCALGTFRSSPGATSCTPAPPNTYVDTLGATAPTACPAGTFNPNSGSTSSAACVPLSFRITTTSLPDAVHGSPYGPATVQAAGERTSANPYVTTLKWKKVSLPRGMKLSKAGVLSGTPNVKLAAGPSSVTVQVTETVTTLNGTKKVKTKTTVQATIPLTIT